MYESRFSSSSWIAGQQACESHLAVVQGEPTISPHHGKRENSGALLILTRET